MLAIIDSFRGKDIHHHWSTEVGLYLKTTVYQSQRMACLKVLLVILFQLLSMYLGGVGQNGTGSLLTVSVLSCYAKGSEG